MRTPVAVVVAVVVPLLSSCVLANPDFDALSSLSDTQPSTSEPSTSATTSATTSVTLTGETVATTRETSGGTSGGTADTTTTTATDTTTGTTTTGTTTTGDLCTPEAPQGVGPEIVLAPQLSDGYAGFILGQVPGIPAEAHLGGIALAENQDDTLLVAAFAETKDGELYTVGLLRGPCGHIIGFDGEASLVDTAANISDILVLANGPLIYSEWDTNHLAQRVEGIDKPVRTDLGKLAPPIPKSVAGIGLVPPGLAAAGELRVLSWDTGDWYHLSRQLEGDSFLFESAVYITSLPTKSGGLAYVPAGSPGFEGPHVVITRPEEDEEHVVVFQVDAQGDPIIETRKVLVSDLYLASNVYFDRVSGDLLLSTLETEGGDRLYVVQGFAKPAPLQP